VLLTAKATLFWQLEDSFPLLSAEERDCIYNKSYIVNSSTSAIISRKKRHNLLLHQCHLQQQQHIFQPIAAGFTARVVIS